MKVYLSGPMTGLPNLNYKEFNRWAKKLRANGHTVLNPAENDGGSTDRPRPFYMRLDTENLLQAHAVALLPGWEHSKGVRYELVIANELELNAYLVEDLVKQRPIKVDYAPVISIVQF